MPAISVDQISKSFEISKRRPGVWGALCGLLHRECLTLQALAGISFEIERGEMVGYIGPNGAGKSTTVKILSGIMFPSGGRAEVLGRVPWRQRLQLAREIGVVFGQRTQLWWDLPVIESFELLQAIYRISPARFRETLDELIALFTLEPLLDTPVRQLSLGQRMRCDLAAALLHRPAVLFLDEPTIGLDAVSKLAMRDHIKALNARQGVTVVLTTHDMDDIEALCRRVLVLNEGTILFDGALDGLRARLNNERYLTVLLAGDAPSTFEGQFRVVRREGQQITLAFDPCTISAPALIAHITALCDVRDLFVENPPVEKLIADLYHEVGQ